MTGTAAARSPHHAAVLAAWKKALKNDRCNPALTWGEAGADSIASLHLILELGRSGRSLTFDDVRPHMLIEDIVALLDGATAAATPVLQTTLPPIHLFPGLYGDDPRLANFRHALDSTVSVHLHELPDLRQRAATLWRLDLTGEAAAKTVAEHQPEGPVFLAGFSFGGGVAFEVARVLTRAGRRVALLVLLDTLPGEVLATSVAAYSMKELKRRLQLALSSSNTLRTFLLEFLDRTSPMLAYRIRRYLFGLFREHAMRQYRPAPLAVNTLLAVSEEYGPRTEPIWRRLCPQLEVVRLPNGHVQMFEQPALGQLAPAFDEAVHRAAAVALGEPGRYPPTPNQGRSYSHGDDDVPA